MATDVDSLQIEIGASSESASKQIRQLIDDLKDLQKTTNGSFNNPVKNIVSDSPKRSRKNKNVEEVKESVKTEEWIEVDADTKSAERKIRGIRGMLKDVSKRFNISVGTEEIDEANKKVSLLAKTLNGLTRIAFYRAIRSGIKAVGDAFREGQENAYWYSQTVGGEIGYIARQFDSLSSAGFKMTNQLGAAWATLKAAVIPILIQIANFATAAANAITQLFAALSGKSVYLKATDMSKQWATSTAKGAKAAKEWRNQLMGFDEINRLEAPSSGGGGGGGAAVPDYSSMFETKELSKWAKWIQDHLKIIKDMALAIGAAFLGWKIASAFGASLKTCFGLAMSIYGAVMLVKGGLDAWNNGVSWSNLFEMLVGVSALAIGLGIAFGSTGAAIGLLIGGITLLVVGIKDFIENGKLSTEAFVAIEAGILAIGGAIALFTGSWIPLVIAAVVGLVVAVVKNWDKIKAFFKNFFDSFKQEWNDFKSSIQEALDSVSAAWDAFKDYLKSTWNDLTGSIRTFVGGAVSAWSDFTNAIVNAWNKIKDTASSVWNAVVDVVRWAINSMIGKIEGWINSAIGGINWLLSGVSSVVSFLSGTSVSLRINPVSLPRFANGGFPEDGLFLANHNELVGQFQNGRTAVANNEQIVSGIASGVEEANEPLMTAVIAGFAQVISAIDRNGGSNGYDISALSREVSKYQARTARAIG